MLSAKREIPEAHLDHHLDHQLENLTQDQVPE